MAELQSGELKWKGHHTFLISQFQFMLKKESHVDVILANTEGQSIKVHRLVLSAASPFFKDLLSQHNPSEEITTITLQDISYVILKTLVKFIYKGEITVKSKAQLSLFLETALALKIKGLMENSLPSKGSNQKEEEEKLKSQTKREIPVEIKADSSIIGVFDDDVEEAQEKREPSESDEDEERQEVVADELLYVSEHSSLEDINSSPDESSDNEAAAEPLGSKRKARMTSPKMSIHHSKRGMNQQSISQRTAAEPSRPFECSRCGRNYKRKDHLIRHSATHECVKVVTPNQPYECVKCGRCYKRKDHLVRHSAHEYVGIDPSFACSKCNYRARRKYHLSRHLKEFHRITHHTEITTVAASGTMLSF